jgi:hypothetical protein
MGTPFRSYDDGTVMDPPSAGWGLGTLPSCPACSDAAALERLLEQAGELLLSDAKVLGLAKQPLEGPRQQLPGTACRPRRARLGNHRPPTTIGPQHTLSVEEHARFCHGVSAY